MEVLFAASECAPFIKTGGLGDVIGALPLALKEQGVRVKVVLPKYEDLPFAYKKSLTFVDSVTVPVGWREQYCGVERLRRNGIDYYFLDNEYYFKRHGSYGYFDDGERFAFFSRAVLEVLPVLGVMPDVIHCHDWQTGPISALLKAHYQHRPSYRAIKTVFTIHNLKYLGIFPKDVLANLLDLSDLYFQMDGLEFYGDVSYMKAGLAYSDQITTVSPTYAEEIQYPYFGEKLNGFFRYHRDSLQGIVNGIDAIAYDPKEDPHLFTSITDVERKKINKAHLQKELGLPAIDDVPLLSLVTRLDEQKGLDLVLRVFHELMGKGMQVILLGTGDRKYEDAFQQLGQQYPDQFRFCCYFDESLAHQIYGGSDMFLMPSRFEPCGIGQMLALRYGTIPIVRETGGLKDTVVPYDPIRGSGYGFSFTNYNAHDMLYTIEFALSIYRFQPVKWKQLIERAMDKDFSWDNSAKLYKNLYTKLLPKLEVKGRHKIKL